jgi:predicted small secreted protein
MRRTIMLLAISGLGLLAACATIEGAGKDLQSAGKAISKTAKDVAD